MASTRTRQLLPLSLLCGTLVLGAGIGTQKSSFARDGAPQRATAVMTQTRLEDNVATDASTATFDETVKWLTDSLVKNGSSHYTKVVSVGSISMPLKTDESITAASVKSDALELTVVSSLSGTGPVKTQVTETLSVPLRLIKRVTTADGDPSLPAAAAKHGQFSYVTITVACDHNDIEDRARTKTMSPDDNLPAISGSTDIVRELNIHLDQSYDYCQRIEKAIRHLAKLARETPAVGAPEPF